MTYNNVVLTVHDAANVPVVRSLLAELAVRSRAEPGCVAFDVFQSQGDARWFLLAERWESPSALDAHRQAAAFREIYQPRVLPLVTRTPHTCDLVSDGT
jgi:quinol monooxygenase YgiN